MTDIIAHYFRSRYISLVILMASMTLSSVKCSSDFQLYGPSSSSILGTKRTHCEMDKFVLASPLVIAAVYKDGIVVVATHTSHLYEPLLVEGATSTMDKEDGDSNNVLQDLPSSYKGPTRIEPIITRSTNDCNSTMLLSTAGWKIDCMELVEKCRSIVQSQQTRYGISKQILSSMDELGGMISSMLSHWLANCYVSESVRRYYVLGRCLKYILSAYVILIQGRLFLLSYKLFISIWPFLLKVRPLSCVGILASCSSKENMNLFFIDSTGSYRVRAFAIGNQSMLMNKKLRAIDFRQYVKEQAVERIIELITSLEDEKKEEGYGESHSIQMKKTSSKHALLEIATIDVNTGLVLRMRRKK